MRNCTINLSVDYKKMGFEPPEKPATLTTYILDNIAKESYIWNERPAVIICPGGGYRDVSNLEGEPIARKYTAAGFHAFVLNYSINPIGWPAPCCELAKAVAYVRSIADEYKINKVIVCGFSAGGHLAASSCVHYDNDIIKEFAEVDGIINKPDGMILSYPVITDDAEKIEIGTFESFVAGREESKKFFGLEHFVTPETPKAFIWHTFEDKGVPVENSMKFASSLIENKVSCELHIFPHGGHGLSLADRQTSFSTANIYPEIQPWIDMSCRWINNL